MKRYTFTFYYGLIAALLLLAASACKKDYPDPSGPSEEQAYSTPNALTDVAVGLQAWYSKDRIGLIYTTVTAGSLLTSETFVTNRGNTDEFQLMQGGAAVQNTNVIVTGMWAVSNKIIYEANKVQDYTGRVVTDQAYASGLIAYTAIFKAMALGNLSMYWDHAPDTTGRPDTVTTDVHFITAKEGYRKAVTTLDNAIARITATPIGGNFTRNIPQGLDIVNTLYALKARYALFAGDYAAALDAAGKVNLNVKSVFNYNAQVTNPIFTLVTSSGNIYQVTGPSMGLPPAIQPDPADKRVPFYMTGGTTAGIAGFYNALLTPVPVYLPGEITLIKAECYARQNDLVNGLTELNKVVTKSPGSDPFGVGADLPPVVAATQADLLTQIYKHRRIELFMAGLALEDSRRFNRPQSERKRNYFPYPFVERNDNPNTPPDPSF